MSLKIKLGIVAFAAITLIALAMRKAVTNAEFSKLDKVASESNEDYSGKKLETFVNFSIKNWPSLLAQPMRVSAVAGPQSVKNFQFAGLTCKVSYKYHCEVSDSVCTITADATKIAIHQITDAKSLEWMNSKLLWRDLIHFIPDSAAARGLGSNAEKEAYFKKVTQKMAIIPPTSKIYYLTEGDVFAIVAVGEAGRLEGRAWIQDKCLLLEGNVLSPEDIKDLFFLVSHIESKQGNAKR